jgi:hypothetical protein
MEEMVDAAEEPGPLRLTKLGLEEEVHILAFAGGELVVVNDAFGWEGGRCECDLRVENYWGFMVCFGLDVKWLLSCCGVVCLSCLEG